MMVHFSVRVTKSTTHKSHALLTASGAQEATSPEALQDEITRDLHILYPQEPGWLIAIAVHTHEIKEPT